jgi:Asp/Glu/hydantoin racemase
MGQLLKISDAELYYDHIYALKGVSIELNEGETVARIGANGAEKSSILRAADIPVLALEEPGSNARQKLLDEITRAVREDRCEAVILGCAGMADLTAWLTEETGVPVIDGVAVAVRMVEALVGAGLSTSKVGAYARPLAK